MMSSQTWLPFFIFLILTSISSTFVTAQDPLTYACFNNGNYTSDSTFSNNLNTIFSSLSSDMSSQGFHSASLQGQNPPDPVNVIALCRGDIQPDLCRSCIQDATIELLNLCPNQRQAILWREHCTLRYSNDSIIGNMADSPNRTIYNVNNVNGTNHNPEQFSGSLISLIDELRGQAALGGSLIKIAADDRTAPDFQRELVYALLQCSPDISPDDCRSCLSTARRHIPFVSTDPNLLQVGMRILLPSCNLRYETSPFYNLSRIREAQATPVEPALPPPPVPSPPGNGNDDNTTRTVMIIVIVIIVSLTIAACIGMFIKKRRKHKPEERLESDEEMSTIESLQYDFGKIRAATNDFSDSSKLGQGGFGAVYKGRLQNGQEIAVKRLSKGSAQGNIEFKNEVMLVARLQHRNLVRLLGFALEGTERLLVYEFVENASLDQFIFGGIARGLLYLHEDSRLRVIHRDLKAYLHEDSRLRVIHRDLKASNILLDAEMNPKIADFGMARLFELDESEGITSKIVGTYGYMPPEYLMHGQFSVKSDVFSFGVLVLEIISRQKNNTFRNGENLEDLLSFAWRNWREGTTNIIDPVLSATSGSLQEMMRCIHIGLLCVQEIIGDRPTMGSIVLMLNSFSITLQLPSQPAFFVSTSFGEDTSLLHNHKSRELEFKESSKNDASITELYPR